MKFSMTSLQTILLSFFLCAFGDRSLGEVGVPDERHLTPQASMLYAQTFFIPLPEEAVFEKTFREINWWAEGPVISLISVTVSTDNTVLVYDHWEDGYEEDPAHPKQPTTEIWGDGDPSNGCLPTCDDDGFCSPTPPSDCTVENDFLNAGDSIVIKDLIKREDPVYYDGKDLIKSTLPIAVTRGAYPNDPGSLMAGAVEVLDTQSWGKVFEAPVGEDLSHSTYAYQYTAFYIMAEEDGTEVKVSDGSLLKLGKGESKSVRIDQGATLESNKNIQVDLLTGDVDSTYELRWFSLLPVGDWSTAYLSPMGDSVGKTKVVMYNPGNTQIKVSVQTLDWSKDYWIEGKTSEQTKTIEYGSGAILVSDDKFIALSMTDTEYRDGNKKRTKGMYYDWGFPVVPLDMLSPQVLVGLGYGCTYLDECKSSKSAVFITPIADADIHVDYENDGVVDDTVFSKRLESHLFTDESDKDMSGAYLFATKPGSGVNGDPVDIAAAWGQNPAVSYKDQRNGLDLGTVVLPVSTIQAKKHVELIGDADGDGKIGPGDTLRYTIRVINMGQVDQPPHSFMIYDQLEQMTYVGGTCEYNTDGSVQKIPDVGGEFPLEAGISNPTELKSRGGQHDLSFHVVVSHAVTSDKLVNSGYVQRGDVSIPFEVTSDLAFYPSIDLEKTVCLGHDGKNSCSDGKELVSGPKGTDNTYCYRVINTGNTHLKVSYVSDDDIGFKDETVGILAPGQEKTIVMEEHINRNITSDGYVIAEPVFQVSGDRLPEEYEDVEATDPAGVVVEAEIVYNAAIQIEKTVYLGDDGPNSCNRDELVKGVSGSDVTYCYYVKNVGDTHLTNVLVRDPHFGHEDSSIGSLAPEEMKLLSFKTTLDETITTTAQAIGVPADANLNEIEKLPDVTDVDDAGVDMFCIPSVQIQKSCYKGHGRVDDCRHGKEVVEDTYKNPVTYCYAVTNTGECHLNKIEVTDPAVEVEVEIPGILPPGKTTTVVKPSNIFSELTSAGTVVANPAKENGDDIPQLSDVSADDTAGVKPLYNPSILIEKTVKLGLFDEYNCMEDGKEEVSGQPGTDVTYCYYLYNDGSVPLDQVNLVDPGLDYKEAVPLLKPGFEYVLAIHRTIEEDAEGEATVTGNPVLDNLRDIPGLPDVSDNDGAGHKVIHTPAIQIDKTVKLGVFDGTSCGEGSNLVKGKKGADVTYCMLVSNIGTTPLNGIEITDPMPFEGKVPLLKPGEQFMVAYPTTIEADLVTNATVVATPSDKDGNPLSGLDPVTDYDPAGVDKQSVIMGAGEAPKPFCMQEAWEDSDKVDELICNRQDVYFEPDTIAPNSAKTCEEGGAVYLSITAGLRVTKTLYDVAWYVALDGGDALEGECMLGVLEQKNSYKVVEKYGSDEVVGSVSWNNDMVGGPDECGDVSIHDGVDDNGGSIPVDLVKNKSLKCVDDNGDGNLDVTVCLSYREGDDDNVCTFSPRNPNMRGRLPDVYPSSATACVCMTYDVVGVRVNKPDDEVKPC